MMHAMHALETVILYSRGMGEMAMGYPTARCRGRRVQKRGKRGGGRGYLWGPLVSTYEGLDVAAGGRGSVLWGRG